MWLSVGIGIFVRKRQLKLDEDVWQDLDFIVADTLTLLGLIIGFSFSIAIGRYLRAVPSPIQNREFWCGHVWLGRYSRP